MSIDNHQTEIIFRTSRSGQTGLLFISVIFILIGVLLVNLNSPGVGWFLIILFGVIGIIFLFTSGSKGMYIKANQTHLEIKSLVGTKRIKWNHIEAIDVHINKSRLKDMPMVKITLSDDQFVLPKVEENEYEIARILKKFHSAHKT